MREKKKILIVEDEEINRELLNIFLKKEYSLTFTDHLDAATRALNEEQFHLVITDIRLADRLDGIEVLKHSRSSMLNKSTSVVAYTASDNSINQKSYAEEGFDGFISKPMQQDLLLKKIAGMLAVSSQ
jgi:two-component system sensor histidine kinase BarA